MSSSTTTFSPPYCLSILASISNISNPVQHSLFIVATSWLFLCALVLFRVGISSGKGAQQRRTAWLAGALIALSHICDRAAGDKEGIWATKPLLPLFTVLFSNTGLLFSSTSSLARQPHVGEPESKTNALTEAHPYTGSYRLLTALVVSAGVVLASYSIPSTSTLGLSSAIFAALGLLLFDAVLKDSEDDAGNKTYGYGAEDGTPYRQISLSEAFSRPRLAALRDIAGAIIVICGIASWFMEPSLFVRSRALEPAFETSQQDWRAAHDFRSLQYVPLMVLVNFVANMLTFITLLREGAVFTSLLTLFSFMCAKIHFVPSLLALWFTALNGISACLYSSWPPALASIVDARGKTRFKRVIFGLAVLSTGLLLIQTVSRARHQQQLDPSSTFAVVPPPSPFEPVPIDLSQGHPAAQLIKAAETEFQTIWDRQSKSLAEAVQEYRRRNGIAPPPNFDQWYQLASRNKVVMIDEFDTINDMLLPFWAVKPETIRSRVTNALGHEDIALIGVAIRDGSVKFIENGEKWQQAATLGMLKNFVQYLPDMDLAFNVHDEPRVVVPHNLLSDMITKARNEVLLRTAKNVSPRNAFSNPPNDITKGKHFVESTTTRFNRFAHQQTWTHSRLSCPINSQAQTFEDYAADNLTTWAASPLNYVYNTTAFSDICNSPSFSSTFGFFERPNTFNVVNDLTPVFSSSKISSYQDLLYPSPWYWAGKVKYEETHDTSWDNKTNNIYWRGSTTGGYSRKGGWRRQHRQHIVQRLNAPDKAQVLIPVAESVDTNPTAYSVVEVDRRSFKHLINVKFSHVGQCDPGDCAAQKEFFHVTDHVDGQNAWYQKHLLDMDGNAFSGRFYSFLKSRSLTYKMALFREWHTEWLRPWVHYVPISLKGDEHLDLIKWFSGGQPVIGDEAKVGTGNLPDKGGNGDSLGERKAREIAQRSTEWHDKVLRNVDFEVWLFRLLLEYGRVIDDNREEIGYPGP